MIWTIQQTVDLAHGDQAASRMNYVNPLAYPGDKNAHEWRVTVKRNGASVDLSNAYIRAFVKRVDGSTVPLDGSGTSDGIASVIFDPEVYLFQGQISAIMRATIGDSIITIASLNATILANLSGPPYVDPEGLIPSVEDLLTILPRMETATEAAETAAQEVNDIVIVSDTQPTSETNKLWFTPNGTEVEVPTMEEFERVQNDVNNLSSLVAGKTIPNGGSSGQSLRKKSGTDYDVEWASVGLPTDEQTATAISDWLDNHPEATTTVENGSITKEKLSNELLSQWQEAKPLIAFVTPSYGDSAYYPTTYSLALSYDGITFNEIIGTTGIVGNGFRGGGDVIITKIGGWYICVVNSGSNDLDKQIYYVTTKDFMTYSNIKYFDDYKFGTYLVNTYNLTSDFVKGRQWEPNIFLGLDGKYYITLSGAYAVDAEYENTISGQTTTYKKFKQLYAPVVFDAETQTLIAESGGGIQEFAFPANVDTVIDAQVVAKSDSSGYWYLYKDEMRLTSHIAQMASLTDTPVNVVSDLLGTTFAENPYMVDYGEYKNIYLTNYAGGNIGREGWVIKTIDMDYFEASPYAVNANTMVNGRKNRSLHPIVISNNEVIRTLLTNGCINGYANPAKNPRTLEESDVLTIPSISQFFKTEIELNANILYIVPRDTEVYITTKWRHNTNLLLFKRTTGTGAHSLTIHYNGGSYNTTLNNDGDISIFSPAAQQWLNVSSSLRQLKDRVIVANENFNSSYGTRIKHIRDALLGLDLFMAAGKYTGDSLSANDNIVICNEENFPFVSLIGMNNYRVPVANMSGKIVGAISINAATTKTIELSAFESIPQNTILTGDFMFSY